MDTIFQQITDWLKEMLVGGIMNSLTGIFDAVNQQVGNVATQVGTTPASFSPGVFSMIRGVSESVIVPIAGLILTFIACYELIQLIIDHNNLANFETWIFFKWIFKTFVAVMLITNCFNITMAVFDVAQHVIASAGGIIGGNTSINDSAIAGMQSTLEAIYKLCELLYDQKDYSRIHEYAAQALKYAPEEEKLYYWMIVSLRKRDMLELARKTLDTAKNALDEEYYDLLLEQLKGFRHP